MKNTLKVDMNKFKKIWFLGIIYIAIVFVLFVSFSSLFGSTAQKILPYTQVASVADLTNQNVDSIYGILWFIVFLLVLFVALQLAAYAFFEHTIWNVIFGKKTTAKSTGKFLGFSLLMSLLLAVAVGGVFLVISFISSLSTSLAKPGAWTFYLAASYGLYALFIGFIVFTKTHVVFKSIPETFAVSFKKLKHTGIPFVISVIILLATNAIIALFAWLPKPAFSTLIAVSFAAYLAWFRLYLVESLKSVKF